VEDAIKMNIETISFNPEIKQGYVILIEEADLPYGYAPSKDEPYMNPRQLEYFKRKLLKWREQLLRESDETLSQLKQESERETDFIDQGSREADTALKLRTRDRARRLTYKIEEALDRIKNGTYGYCEETGEEIGIRRLEARPIATYCLEAQQWHERQEKSNRERHWEPSGY
jgi:DnaK suppressor protein